MKRLVSMVLICSLFLAIGLPVYAQATPVTKEGLPDSDSMIITYDDGSYCVITITEVLTRATKSGTKTREYYSSDDVLQWKVQVHGTFTYNGVTSSCTSTSHTVTIYNNQWFAHSQNSYKSGNKAIADVTMKLRVLGIVVMTKDVHLELACDKNGNLS